MRLDKYLSELGIATRSETGKMLKEKRIKINEALATKKDMAIDEINDQVYVDGKLLEYKEFEYYMLNKPAGYISESILSPQSVISLITGSNRKGLFPVGRLDKDTTGLLLITNDGLLAHNLLSPKKHVWKTYKAELKKPLSNNDIKILIDGIDIGDETKTLPCHLSFEIIDERNFATISIHEGRFHQVKRMFEAVGNEVLSLSRTRFGDINLDTNLSLGAYRKLKEEEILLLKGNSLKNTDIV